ncbi:hypothetical protein GOODEAATRI_031501, partial [Goodea atripinnis]
MLTEHSFLSSWVDLSLLFKGVRERVQRDRAEMFNPDLLEPYSYMINIIISDWKPKKKKMLPQHETETIFSEEVGNILVYHVLLVWHQKLLKKETNSNSGNHHQGLRQHDLA